MKETNVEREKEMGNHAVPKKDTEPKAQKDLKEPGLCLPEFLKTPISQFHTFN
jgi:hypothetical protein